MSFQMTMMLKNPLQIWEILLFEFLKHDNRFRIKNEKTYYSTWEDTEFPVDAPGTPSLSLQM